MLTGTEILAVTAVTSPTSALPPIDAPEQGEIFSHFFERITRGGQFRGIRLDAPKTVQDAFLPRIRQANWVGTVDRERRALTSAGIDLWGVWYRERAPARLLFQDPAVAASFAAALGDALKREGSTMTAAKFLASPWEGLGRAEKQAFLDAYCLEAPVFGGRALVSYVSAKYGLDPLAVLSQTKLRLLDSPEFAAEVQRLGWHGEIYFRGITAPDHT